MTETMKLCGLEEAQVNAMIEDLTKTEGNLTLTMETMPGEVHLLVTSKGEEKETRKERKALIRELKLRFGAHIYTTEQDKHLETVVVELLKNQGLTVTTVESCTGGALSARIVDVPGASAVFKQGFITCYRSRCSTFCYRICWTRWRRKCSCRNGFHRLHLKRKNCGTGASLSRGPEQHQRTGCCLCPGTAAGVYTGKFSTKRQRIIFTPSVSSFE